MNDVLNKTRYYFREYISNVGRIKILVMPAVLALIIANYLEIQCTNYTAQMTSQGANKDDGFSLLKFYISFVIVSYTLKYVVNLFNIHFIAISMRSGFKNFFREYLMIKYASFRNIGVGEVQYNIMRRAAALADFLTTLTMSFISNIFFFFLVIHSVNSGVPANIKLILFFCLTVFLLLSSLIQFLRAKIRRKVNDGLQENSRKLYDILFNYERIVAYDNVDVECGKYWDSMHGQTYYGRLYWVSYETVGFINSLFFIFLNVYLIHHFNLISSMNVGNLKEFMMLITKLREKVVDISRNIDEICTSFTNLDQSLIEDCPLDDAGESLQLETFESEIQIKDLAFGYSDKLVLRDVNYTVSRGDKIAITGVNGAGKSTFVKILLGLYDYTGSLKIDGFEYTDLSKKSIRRLISYIPQNSYLFDGTIMDNLTVGNEGLAQEKLVEYCKLYNTHKLFKELGYNNEVGERGKSLSGGQGQKVSFMRAVIKNAPIFILDEATSNMDSVSEQELIHSIFTHMTSKTVFMIIHNLNLLHNFDKIIFFDNNTLEEEGNFDDLYRANGSFTQFYKRSIDTSD